MTGWRLTSLMPAMMRCLSSYFEATRMWRKTERANLEKKPSTRLSQEPCLGVKVNSKRSVAWRRPLGARARNVRQSSNILTAHRQFDRIPPSCITPILVQPIANEESTNRLPVPLRPVSWNRSSSRPRPFEERLAPHSSDAAARASVERQCCVKRGGAGAGGGLRGVTPPFRPDTPRVVARGGLYQFCIRVS
jgi:hypothetical protein